MSKMNHFHGVPRPSVRTYPFLGLPPSNRSREAEDFQKQVAEEIAKMRGNERARDMLQDFDDANLEHELSSEPDDSQPLTVEPPLTLSKIIPKLTVVERLWMARIVKAHGKDVVLARWPAYEIHINYVRYLR
ncbi:MAG: hypothetical protein JNL29_06145 [Nitrospira sp.]|nr:hypothetical protein [Nitrospira sp.]